MTCWLIERTIDGQSQWLLFTAHCRPRWMYERSLATRYSREKDAVGVIKHEGFTFDVRAVEHTFEGE